MSKAILETKLEVELFSSRTLLLVLVKGEYLTVEPSITGQSLTPVTEYSYKVQERKDVKLTYKCCNFVFTPSTVFNPNYPKVKRMAEAPVQSTYHRLPHR